MPKYLAPIDLNNNELQNAVIQNLATAPANPIKGLVYYNTTDNDFYIYNGETWDSLTTGISDYNLLSNIPITVISNTFKLSKNPPTIDSMGVYKVSGSISIYSNLYNVRSGLIFYNDNNTIIIDGDNITLLHNEDGVVTSKTVLTEIPDLSDTYINNNQKGVANGIATLDDSGLIPSEQLPSYVDDVIEGYYKDGNFYSGNTYEYEITPETGKIYVDLSTNQEYRWSGSTYISISNPIDIATENDATTGTNNTKVMTPLRTKQAIDSRSYQSNIGDGSSTSFKIEHNLNSKNIIVRLYDNTSNEEIYTDVYISDDNYITINTSVAPSENAIKVVIFKVN